MEERQSSSPSPEVEMMEERGGGSHHIPKSPTNDILHKQVEELLNRSKEIPEEHLEVKVETLRRSRKELEKKKRKKGERSSSSSNSSSGSSSSSSSSEERVNKKKKKLQPKNKPKSTSEINPRSPGTTKKSKQEIQQEIANLEKRIKEKRAKSSPRNNLKEAIIQSKEANNAKTVSMSNPTIAGPEQRSAILEELTVQLAKIQQAKAPPGFVQSFCPLPSPVVQATQVSPSPSPPSSLKSLPLSSSPLSSKGPVCNFCSNSYSTEELEGHRAQEHRLEMFECLVDNCGTLELKAKMLLNHLAYKHSLPSKAEDLEMLAATGKVRLPLGLASCKCKVCKRMFCGAEAKNHLVAHMKSAHKKTKEKIGSFHCRLCDIQVAGDLEMQQHSKAHKESVEQSIIGEEMEKNDKEGAESP